MDPIVVRGRASFQDRLRLVWDEEAVDDGLMGHAGLEDLASPGTVSGCRLDGEEGEESAAPSSAGPARSERKYARKARRQAVRSAARAAGWLAQKDAEASRVAAAGSALSDMPLSGGFIGHRKVRRREAESAGGQRVVGHDGGKAAEILDRARHLVAYRAWQGSATQEANGLLTAAAAYVVKTGIKPTYTSSKRGTFSQYYFTLHKDNQPRPRMSKYFCEHVEVAHELARVLAPVIRLVAGIFRRNFPLLYEYYARTLDYAVRGDASLESLFHPFASFALNVGEVVCERHLDCTNLGPGLCCIVPFGRYNPSADCRVGLADLECEIEVGPGVPLLIPSAAFTHYNTPLTTQGACRGSAVFWTGGTLFQFQELGGRMVSELSTAERHEYQAGRSSRITAGIARFPKRPF